MSFFGISLSSYASSESLMATYLLQKKREVSQEKSYLHEHAIDLRHLVHICQNPKTLAKKEKRESLLNLVAALQKIPKQDRSEVLWLIKDRDEKQIIFNAVEFSQGIKQSDL